MHAFTLESRRVALRAFLRLADRWGLTLQERRKLLGCGASQEMDFESLALLNDGALNRVSFVLGIYAALHTLFPDAAQADRWIKRHNVMFGSTALERMLADGTEGLRAVREYLDSQVG